LDMAPEPMESAQMQQVLAIWNPLYFKGPDGREFAAHVYYLHYGGSGFRHERFQGHFEFQDGSRQAISQLTPRLQFDPINKRLLGGEWVLTLADGRVHRWQIKPVSQTGFHLGAGLYHGMDGKFHGQWRGRTHLEGEYFADCSLPESVARLNQFRDCVVQVHDEQTGATGWGNCQTYVQGVWPEMGLG